MQKVHYELDLNNRLVLKSGKKSTLTGFRRVIDGRFKVNKNNELSYRVKSPVSRGHRFPNQFRLRGEWSLTNNHDLRLTLDKESRKTFGDKVTLEGKILDVKANSLLFAITTKTKEGVQKTYVLNLGGAWKTDKYNRLSFHVKREKQRTDILTFKGVWEINKNHEIVYRYEKALLIRKKRKIHTLIFKGHWDIKKRLRISYVLSKDTNSVFDFTARAGILKERYIKYEVGIGLKRKAKPLKRTVTLFGRWKMKKASWLTFEVEYENKKIREIVFRADARLTNKDTVLFRLKNDVENKSIGVSLKLSRKILKGRGEAFVRLLKSKHESALYAGATQRW